MFSKKRLKIADYESTAKIKNKITFSEFNALFPKVQRSSDQIRSVPLRFERGDAIMSLDAFLKLKNGVPRNFDKLPGLFMGKHDISLLK